MGDSDFTLPAVTYGDSSGAWLNTITASPTGPASSLSFSDARGDAIPIDTGSNASNQMPQATNVTTSAPSPDFLGTLKATGDSLLSVYGDITKFQIARDTLSQQTSMDKLKLQTMQVQANGQAAIVDAQTAKAKAMAQADAQIAINQAARAAAASKGQTLFTLPTDRLTVICAVAGLGLAVYSALKHRGA